MDKIQDFYFRYALEGIGGFNVSDNMRASDAETNAFFYDGSQFWRDIRITGGFFIENLLEYIGVDGITQEATGFLVHLYNPKKKGTNECYFTVGIGTEDNFYETAFFSFMDLRTVIPKISISVPSPPVDETYILRIFALLK